MKTAPLMKDQLGLEAITLIANALSAISDDFPSDKFIHDASQGVENLELKQRVQYLIRILHDYLPIDFTSAAALLFTLADNWKKSQKANTNTWGSFTAWPLIDYVAVYGLKHPELSLQLLKELTPLFSAEFAVRPFIEAHFELTHQTLLLWCLDKDEHVRRLASEGIRPRLPWGKQLPQFIADPAPIIPILELLNNDASVYVRKSVANNLNDITKDNPEVVIHLCQQWANSASSETLWIIRHGLRSLVKQGRPEVFPLLGFSEHVKINVKQFKIDRRNISLGERLTVRIELESKSNDQQKCVVDYKIYHQKANGRQTSKVFKLKNINLAKGESIYITKVHPFKVISTRQYYAGQHAIELLINGKPKQKITFELHC